MKKHWIMMMVLSAFCLIACLPQKDKKVVCAIKDNNIDLYLSAYYGDKEEVNKVEMQFNQIFSEQSVKDLNEKDIVEELKSIFIQSNNPDVDLEVEYDKKIRSANVSISVSLDKMNENDLSDLNLKKDKKVFNFIKQLTIKGYDCGVKQ